MSQKRIDLLVCCGSSCISAGALKLKEALVKAIEDRDLTDEVNIIGTGCMGPCEFGPVLVVYPEGIFYKHVAIEDIDEIVEEHIIKGRPLERLMVQDNEKTIRMQKDVPFYHKQIKVALENCGLIDPESMEEYIATGGYQALGMALTTMTPQGAIDIVKASGLRGRGGGGFPAYRKWQMVHDRQEDEKYIICNGDEGDPGAFMDRSILEGDPHRVLEGMMIAAYSIGASQGFFYIRAEYPLAIKRIRQAIEQARSMGLMGKNIFGTDFCFEAEVRTGAGAFVCGEEMALIHSIEGERGNPTPKPPYPAVRGLWGKPTVVNNVETFANIPSIFVKGADWFAGMGTEDSKGTKVFALTGDVCNTGLVEVPMGITLRELIYEVGGGIIDDRKFKAVQLGGPSGGCLTSEHLDLGVDYKTLKEHGAMMGSGGVIVMDQATCMVDVARFFLRFTQSESCGKCTPCREGTKRMLEILDRICSKQGREGDLELLQELGEHIQDTSLCQLGASAPNPVLSTLQYFREEYEAHIRDKRCPANVCAGMRAPFEVDLAACIGCGLCARLCPVGAVSGERRKPHRIDAELCISCGACAEKCPVRAIAQGA